MSGQYITVRETAQTLGISEKKVMDLIETGHIQAYRIADQFLRLKRNEVMQMRASGQVKSEQVAYEYTFTEKFKDFFYFNDFYIFSLLAILGLLYYILIA